MNADFSSSIDAFAGFHVLGIRDAMLDTYLEGTTDRLCPEAPVPVVSVSSRSDLPGGAANTAVNIRGLGGQVSFLSALGEDNEGRQLLTLLEDRGISTEYIVASPGRRTLTKQRVTASSQTLLRFDQGTTEAISGDSERALIGRLQDSWSSCDAAIVSDYGYGILKAPIIWVLAKLQAEQPRVLVVDSKRQLNAFQRIGATVVKPNYSEIARLLGLPATECARARAEQVAAHGERILDLTGARIAAVTLDSEGAIFFEKGGLPYRTYACPVRSTRSAGAGDTFAAALALALASSASTAAAAELASAAAAIVVGKDGTAACSAQELREYFSAEGKYISDRQRLADRCEFYRAQGKRIVFTNGCFDILHRGHIAYLNRAKALGDVLIVGVNTDAGIQRLKGPDRPINSLEDRVQVLAALSCVDDIVAFDEDLPCELIRI